MPKSTCLPSNQAAFLLLASLCSLLALRCCVALSLCLRHVSFSFCNFRAKLDTPPPPHTPHSTLQALHNFVIIITAFLRSALQKKQLGNHCDFRRAGGVGEASVGRGVEAGDPRETIAAFGCSHMWEKFPTTSSKWSTNESLD